MGVKVVLRCCLWLSVQVALWFWAEGLCSTESDINIWQTSGICVNSENDMTECGSDISNIFVSDEVSTPVGVCVIVRLLSITRFDLLVCLPAL